MTSITTPTRLLPKVADHLASLGTLKEALLTAKGLKAKESILKGACQTFALNHIEVNLAIESLPLSKRYLLKSLIAAKQEHIVLARGDQLKALCDELSPIEAFYADIGGLVGYQWAILSLLHRTKEETNVRYIPPKGIDISGSTPFVRRAVLEGLKNLPKMAEIYPIGGAADRLGLKDESAGKSLPAARFHFMETNLLERLIRDLEAREALYAKLFGHKVITPVAMMTSHEKEGDAHIRDILEQTRYFNRPKESFRLFSQPLIPTFNREGRWCMERSRRLKLKPGGHGVIWQLALQEGIFDWLESLGRKKALIRQINNPIAGTDNLLLAFAGVGFMEDRPFGFASCPRLVHSKEGMNVVRERRDQRGTFAALTNVEYCDFAAHNIEDIPEKEGGCTSLFPSNTNILFADLMALKEAALSTPFPGPILNFKMDEEQNEPIARLETTMQNIADALEIPLNHSFVEGDETHLKAFLTHSKRRKTISVTKKSYKEGESLLETPAQCLFDFLKNSYELLSEHCHVKMPPPQSLDDYVKKGPSFLFNAHPALGPLFSIIGQKIRGGRLHIGSELMLEISDLVLTDFFLQGSLVIHTDHVIGDDDEIGHCTLSGVTIVNKGLGEKREGLISSKAAFRHEALTIILGKNSHFIAEDVVFEGGHTIEVPDNTTVKALSDGTLVQEREGGPPRTEYSLGKKGEVRLRHSRRNLK